MPEGSAAKPCAGGAWRWRLGTAATAGILLVAVIWGVTVQRNTETDGGAVRTIAALPFDNIGSTEQYFSAGVTEEILNRMVGVEGLRVISRDSSFLFDDSALDITEIGERLGADYILHGSAQREDSVVRIHVRLSETLNGTELWASSYDRELTEILRLQEEVARMVVHELVPSMVGARSPVSTVDPRAYDLYLRAVAAMSANDPFSARWLLKESIGIDPEFPKAYGALANVENTIRYWGDVAFAGDAEITHLIDQALHLDPDNVDALVARSWQRLWVDNDLQDAVEAFESRVQRTHGLPGLYGYALTLKIAKKRAQMQAVSERIQTLDPYSVGSGINAFNQALDRGRFDRARRALDRLPRDPTGPDCWSGRRCWLILHSLFSGRLDEAARRIGSMHIPEPIDVPVAVTPATMDYATERVFGMWLAVERGQLDRARQLDQGQPWTTMSTLPHNWIPLHAILSGDVSGTIDEIESPSQPQSMVWIMLLPYRTWWTGQYGSPVLQEAFHRLTSDPRYQAALAEYGLDDKALAAIEVNTEEVLDGAVPAQLAQMNASGIRF